MAQGGSKTCTPLQCMLQNFETTYTMEDYGEDLDPGTLESLCKFDWTIQSESWPGQGSWDVAEVIKVHRSVLSVPHPDQFPYIDIWLNICQTMPSWAVKCRAKEKEVNQMVVRAPKNKPGREMMKKLRERAREKDRAKVEQGRAIEKSGEKMYIQEPSSPGGKFQLRDVEEVQPPPYNPVYPPLIALQPALPAQPLPVQQQCPPFGENPGPLRDLLQSIMFAHQPTWADIQTLLNTLFGSGDRGQIVAAMQARADEMNGQNAAALCPLADPNWNHQDANYRRRAERKTVNLGKIAAVIQGPNESPRDYLERLKQAYSTYSGIDPDAPDYARMVRQSFVAQSAKDIRKKLEKLPGLLEVPLGQLLEVAQKVYGARDTEDEKALKAATTMAALIRGEDPTTGGRSLGRGGRGRGRGTGRGKGSQDRNRCYQCGKLGHWKKDCEEKEAESIMFQTEEQ